MTADRHERLFDLLIDEGVDRRKASPLVALPVVVLAGLLAWLYVEQAVLKTPITQWPLAHAELAGSAARLRWQAVPGADVTYDVQVAREAPRFEEPFFEESELDSESIRFRVSSGETYYWRVRCRIDGKEHRWSAAVPFRMRSGEGSR